VQLIHTPWDGDDETAEARWTTVHTMNTLCTHYEHPMNTLG